jgi:hypothetical protein
MFEAVSKVVLSAPKALQKMVLDLDHFGLFYGSKTFLNPLTSELLSYHLNRAYLTCTLRPSIS